MVDDLDGDTARRGNRTRRYLDATAIARYRTIIGLRLRPRTPCNSAHQGEYPLCHHQQDDPARHARPLWRGVSKDVTLGKSVLADPVKQSHKNECMLTVPLFLKLGHHLAYWFAGLRITSPGREPLPSSIRASASQASTALAMLSAFVLIPMGDSPSRHGDYNTGVLSIFYLFDEI